MNKFRCPRARHTLQRKNKNHALILCCCAGDTYAHARAHTHGEKRWANNFWLWSLMDFLPFCFFTSCVDVVGVVAIVAEWERGIVWWSLWFVLHVIAVMDARSSVHFKRKKKLKKNNCNKFAARGFYARAFSQEMMSPCHCQRRTNRWRHGRRRIREKEMIWCIVAVLVFRFFSVLFWFRFFSVCVFMILLVSFFIVVSNVQTQCNSVDFCCALCIR